MDADIIIIGAGVAGMTAGIYAARAGKSVLIIEGKVAGGQIVESLKVGNWPGEIMISGEDLSKKIYAQVEKLGVKVFYEVVEDILNDKNGDFEYVIKTDETEYRCNALILATGTEPRRLSEKQMAMVGKRPVSYCATCDGALYKNKPVVVVGSGNTAKYEVSYLENIASKVYNIHHDEPIPVDAEAVFVAIGRVPATDYLKGFVDLDTDGYIVAGEDCHTSQPGVFAAGDCRTKSVRQLVTAAADGAVAATEAVRYLG
ncbi:FAD-dependent oxidoreductase [Candidatus Saccharibacteria bacterium]|nr:FAD-dependent oxidoreductase [Candidatus Saccharibacteria bacterium]